MEVAVITVSSLLVGSRGEAAVVKPRTRAMASANAAVDGSKNDNGDQTSDIAKKPKKEMGSTYGDVLRIDNDSGEKFSLLPMVVESRSILGKPAERVFYQKIMEFLKDPNEKMVTKLEGSYEKLPSNVKKQVNSLLTKIVVSSEKVSKEEMTLAQADAEKEEVKQQEFTEKTATKEQAATAPVQAESQAPAPDQQTEVVTNNDPVSEEPTVANSPDTAEQTPKLDGNTSNTITIKGQVIGLEDAQGATSAPTDGNAGYWQGNGSTTDGQATHIIGHNPGIFNVVLSLQIGDQIKVVDRDGNSKVYTVYAASKVNDNGVDPDGTERWEGILSQQGESISLQTCIDDFWNYMVEAR